jgi:hypothetical protein
MNAYATNGTKGNNLKKAKCVFNHPMISSAQSDDDEYGFVGFEDFYRFS